MSKRGKDIVSDDRAESPAPIRRSTRISLGQNLPSSPAPMAIKTRRGSANSSSEEKITVDAKISPKDKRKTRRTSTDVDEIKPGPLRSRRGSVSKVIEEEKASIPNSPGRRSTRLSSSSPSFDAPARRTRKSSQDTDTVEVPARRTTRRSSTGIQESTIEEIVEKAKPVTRRRRSSSVDEQEENGKIESGRPKTKRLFNEDNVLEPIVEQEQEIKQKVVEEEKQEHQEKLEVIKEADDESVKIIAELNEALSENSSPNESKSESVETEKSTELTNEIVTKKISEAEEVSTPNKTPRKSMEKVNGESSAEINEQSLTKEKALDESMAVDTNSEQKPSPLDNSNNDVTKEEDVSSTVNLNDSCVLIKPDKKLDSKDVMSSPGSDKENTSINIKRKRLSIKKLEEVSKKEVAEKSCNSIKLTPNNSICEPMDVDDDEDDIFSSQVPVKNQTPKKSGLNDSIGKDNEKLENGISEAIKENGDEVNIDSSVKENDSVLEGSFSHVNSSPDKDSSLLLTESNSTSTRKSLISSILNESKPASTEFNLVEIEDSCESDASIKLVDTDDELEAAKISVEKEEENLAIASEIPTDQSVDSEKSMKSIDTNDEMKEAEISSKKNESEIASEISFNKSVNITNTELSNASINEVDTVDETNVLEITNDKEDKNKSVVAPEISTNQTVNTSVSELPEASIKLDTTDVEKESVTKDDESSLNSSTNQTLLIDSGLNASVLDESFDSIKNISPTEKSFEANEIVKKDSVEEHNVSKNELDSVTIVNTSVVSEKPDHFVDDLKTPKSKMQLEENDCSEIIEENNPTTITVMNGENIIISPHKSSPVNSRKSLRKSVEKKNDLNISEPQNEVKGITEAISDIDDSKINLSMGNSEEDLKEDLSEVEVTDKNCLNISEVTNDELLKSDIKNENEISDTQKPDNKNIQSKDVSLTEISTLKPLDDCSKENVDIKKIEDQEFNISKSEPSPCKKIILQKIEIVNISDVKAPNIEQSDSNTKENVIENKETLKSSMMESSTRHSFSNDKKKIHEHSFKTRNSLPSTKFNYEENVSMSNTSLSKTKTTIEKNVSENEIHLISDDDEEVIIPKTEKSSPINNCNDDSKENTEKIEDETSKKNIESSKHESSEATDSSEDQNTSQNEASYKSDEEHETSENGMKEDDISNYKKKIISQKKKEIMHRSGIEVEDEESSEADEHNMSNEFIDDMAEEVRETLSEEESDENEIKDIGESVFSSDSDEESTEDDYDLNDSFIDNDEVEELCSGEEDFLQEEEIEKPKKKRFKRIKQLSSTTSEEETSHNKKKRKAAKAVKVEKSEQAEETELIRKDEFEGMIDSILKLSPGESSTPNRNISNNMNSSQITESSVILQETCSVGAAKSRVIIEKIQGVVDVFCKNIKEPEGDISLNVSLNYKPPSNPGSARNSLNMSFGNKDLNQSIKNTPNKSSRLSLNEDKGKASVSPQKLSFETVTVEDRTENTKNDSSNEGECKNQDPMEVVEESGKSKRRKRSKKKKSEKEESSAEEHKNETPVETTNSNKQKGIKRPADQEKCEPSPESKISQTKRKKQNDAELVSFSHKNLSKKHTKKDDKNSEEAVVTKTKKVELNDKKSKRTRDVSESTIERKKIKRNESADIVPKDSKPTEIKKKIKSERSEGSSQIKDKKSKQQNNELLISKTKKTDERHSESETITVKEIKPKKSERLQKEPANVGSSLGALKTSNGNDHGEWDEEDIFIKPSAANNTISGFNFEKYVQRDFKNRMIYDSLRNKRQTSARPKRQK